MPRAGTRAKWRTARACERSALHFAARAIDVAMEAPFGRRQPRAARGSPSSVIATMSSGAVSVVRHARRRHRESRRTPVVPARADVARLAAVDAARFIASAVATTASRSARSRRRRVVRSAHALRKQRARCRVAFDARAMPRSVMRPGDEPRRRHVERVVDRARAVRARSRRVAVCAVVVAAGDASALRRRSRASIGIAVAGRERAVERRRRQRDVERHAVVARGERLVVGADLVADVAVARRRGRRRRARCRRRRGASAARWRRRRTACAGCRAARSSHAVRLAPCSRGRVSLTQHVQRQALGVREEERRGRRAPAAGRERAGIAMGHHVDRAAACVARCRAAARARAGRSRD